MKVLCADKEKGVKTEKFIFYTETDIRHLMLDIFNKKSYFILELFALNVPPPYCKENFFIKILFITR